MVYHRLQNTVSLPFRHTAYSSLQVPEGTNASSLREQFLRQSFAAVAMYSSAGITAILNTRVCVCVRAQHNFTSLRNSMRTVWQRLMQLLAAFI